MTSVNEMAKLNSKSVKFISNCCVQQLLDNGIVLGRNETIVQSYWLQKNNAFLPNISALYNIASTMATDAYREKTTIEENNSTLLLI